MPKLNVQSSRRNDSKEAEGRRCMSGSDEKLCVSEKERGKARMDYVERIMNEENNCDCDVEGDDSRSSCGLCK